MSNVVNFDQYRELKHLLETDEAFRNWVRAFLNELDNPQTISFSNLRPNSNYTISSITLNGVEVTSK